MVSSNIPGVAIHTVSFFVLARLALHCPGVHNPLDPPNQGLGLVWVTFRPRIRVRILKRLGANSVVVQSLNLRSEVRASIRVKLRLEVCSQGDVLNVARVQVFY